MKRNQDASGQAMLDYLNGKRSFEICERDDGSICVSPGPAGYFSPYRKWSPHEKKAVRYAKGKVLDVGCGAGRHALYLQSRGLDVVGIDISPRAIEVCRRRGLKQTKVMSIAQLSSRMGAFDTIIMFGNNFGLFANPGRARWLLRRFHKMTSPSGRILAQTLDPYKTTDPLHLSYHRRNRGRGRMAGQARIRIRYRDLTTPWFDYLLVSRKEMREIVKETGWKVARFIDSGGPNYIAVIEKKT